jgi:hypothetical protein
MLYQLKKHHGLNETDHNYQMIQESCFRHYESIETQDRISQAFDIASSLWAVYGVLAYNRLLQACGVQKIREYQAGRLASISRDLLRDLKEKL